MRHAAASALVVLALTACGGATGITPTHAGTGAAKTTNARFAITIPHKLYVKGSRRPRYISTNTASVGVSVTQGSELFTTTITCASGTCTGNVTAPIGNDTFAVSLLDPHGNVLSSGTKQQQIVAGTNDVFLTFNPIVASVSLAIGTASPPPYLSAIGPSSVPIEVIAKDASGATIIGPGMFVTASDPACVPTTAAPCLTISLNNSDTSGATMLSTPTSFTSATAALSTALSLTGESPPPAFDDPEITVSATGVTNVSNIDVPVSPVIEYAQDLIGNFPFLTSLYGDYATSWAKYENSGAVDINILTSPGSVSTDGASKNVAFLTGGTSDGNLWLFEDNGDNNDPGSPTLNEFGYYKPNSYDYTSVTYAPFEVATMLAGGDGNVWFGEAGSLIVGKIGVPSYYDESPQQKNLPAHAGASIVGLVRGSGMAMIAIVSDGTNTWIETIPSTLAYATERETNPAVPGVNEAGFSPADGNLYLVDNSPAHVLWMVNPATGAGTNLGATNVTAPTTFQEGNSSPNLQAMALLSSIDNSLVYVGAVANGPNVFVHIVPGRKPSAFSLVYGVPDPSSVGCETANEGCSINSIWYVSPSGVAETTDGGNLRFIAFHG